MNRECVEGQDLVTFCSFFQFRLENNCIDLVPGANGLA